MKYPQIYFASVVGESFELFEAFGLTNALMFTSTHQTSELTSQHMFQLPREHLKKEDQTVLFFSENYHNFVQKFFNLLTSFKQQELSWPQK